MMITNEYIGYIAHDTKPDEVLAEIVIPELVVGEEVIGKEKEDTYSVDVTTSNTVTALYQFTGNRVTMPTFKQGESVIVYKYQDSDKFYFKEKSGDRDIRKKEIYVSAFSNKDEKIVSPEHFDKDSSYYFMVDTINKKIILETSDNDKEKAKYKFQIDTKEGIVTFEDNKENSFKLDSTKGELTIKVPHIKVECKDMKVKATDSVDFNTPAFTIGGGKITLNSTIQFNKSSNFKASAKFNGNANTKPASHKPHTHPIA